MNAAAENGHLTPVKTGLVWGLKRSLLAYLQRIPDGAVSIDRGARFTSTYAFLFPLLNSDSFDPTTGSGVLQFGGVIHLHGHFGTMDVTLAEPWLHLDGHVGSLSFGAPGDTAHGVRSTLFEIPDVPRAASVDGTIRWDGLLPSIGVTGAELFKGNYPIGTAFDPLDVRIPVPT
ncbi:HtaA domain-containing protein [Nocardioides sp. NPDC051685]|uniref:HtaA domain-containing protein n=1 Tax=Nocardioides sp. NPDC051685 TaxID=3364334 RepID=UPI0037BC763A